MTPLAPDTLATLREIAAAQPHRLVFATVSGAHLYGFPSADSDFDLRGVHVLPAREVLGLDAPRETIEVSELRDGIELDLVTHDAKKFFTLLLRRNGYVLEQLLSPLLVHTTPAHEELVAIAPECITRYHAHHYLGFVATQWKLFEKERPRRVKPLLYVYRVLLTGIHLARTGELEANLLRLDESFHLAQIPDLVARKMGGPEHGAIDDDDFAFHEREHRRLVGELEAARDASPLRDEPTARARAALDALLVRLRLETI